MDRRRFLTAAIVAPLLAPAWSTRVSAAADGSEIRGTLRRLTKARSGRQSGNVHAGRQDAIVRI
jgi:hypothetical protein